MSGRSIESRQTKRKVDWKSELADKFARLKLEKTENRKSGQAKELRLLSVVLVVVVMFVAVVGILRLLNLLARNRCIQQLTK